MTVMFWNTLHLQGARALRPCLRPPLFTPFAPGIPRHGITRTARFLADKFRSRTIPSFREQLARTNEAKPFSERVKRPPIRPQILYFLAGSGVAFCLAAVKTNMDTEYWWKKISVMSIGWATRPPSTDEMRRTQTFVLAEKLQAFLGTLKEATSSYPIILRNFILITYVNIANPYLNASEGRRLCWKICLLNAAVWVAWQVPRMQGFMKHAFTHHPLSGLSYTLLTCVFSHKSFMHLAFNCLALSSFGNAAYNYLLSEQQYHSVNRLSESTTAWHFLAFFVSAGLFSSLVSHIASTRIMFPRLVSQLSASSSGAAASATTATAVKTGLSGRFSGPPVTNILPSLGASGAIYAAVTLTALGFPDAEVSLVFLPMVSAPSQWGVGALVLLDITGIIRGWKMFDHYAHVGGAAFGALYYAYGPAWWDSLRAFFSSPSQAKTE